MPHAKKCPYVIELSKGERAEWSHGRGTTPCHTHRLCGRRSSCWRARGKVTIALAMACELPYRRGLPLSRWSIAALRQEAVASGIVAQISGTTLWRLAQPGRVAALAPSQLELPA